MLQKLKNIAERAFSKPEPEWLVSQLEYSAESYHLAQNGKTGLGPNRGHVFALDSDTGENHIQFTKKSFEEKLEKLREFYPQELEKQKVKDIIDHARNAIPNADDLLNHIEDLNERYISKTYDPKKPRAHAEKLSIIQQQLENKVYLLKETDPDRFSQELLSSHSPLNKINTKSSRVLSELLKGNEENHLSKLAFSEHTL